MDTNENTNEDRTLIYSATGRHGWTGAPRDLVTTDGHGHRIVVKAEDQ